MPTRRALVAYASRYGSTAEVAMAIAEGLSELGLEEGFRLHPDDMGDLGVGHAGVTSLEALVRTGAAGAEFAILAETSSLLVEVAVPERDAALLRDGQPVA